MTLAIDCSCGAHLEIDDKFAGQTIQCPDCQRALEAPTAEQVRLRTSGFALASLILALIGALTVVGSIMAVILGAIGLRSIARHPDRLTGNGYAVAGMALGVIFTALGLFAYFKVELIGLDRLLREQQWASKLEFGEQMEVSDSGVTMVRPSKNWGVFRDRRRSDNAFVQPAGDALILVDVRDDAHAIGFAIAKGPLLEDNAQVYRERALKEFLRSELAHQLARKRVDGPLPEVKVVSNLKGADAKDPQELLLDVKLGKHLRTFIMKIIPSQGDLLVVAAGARKNRFEALEGQLRQIVNNFKASERAQP
jgi:Domain of unknown function (DUF4190)